MDILIGYQKNTGPIDTSTLKLLIRLYPSLGDFMRFYNLNEMNIKWADYQRYMDLVKEGLW